jgi:hypothetical protein
MLIRNTLLTLFFPALILFSAVGCNQGPPVGTVSGEVTLNGQPYDQASLVFLDMKTGQAASTDIQSGGQFKVPTPLPVGTYNIYLAPKMVEDLDAPPRAVTMDSAVPQKYWNESTTDIIQPIERGENKISIALQK